MLSNQDTIIRFFFTIVLTIPTCGITFAQEVLVSATNPLEKGKDGEDADEEAIIELRLRALQAETDSDGVTANIGAAISLEELDSMTQLPGSLRGLPTEIDYPLDNAPTTERIELGRMLFFDKRLSRDQSMSCATCHDPAKGWSDGLPRSRGFGGRELGRHSPTIINTAFNQSHFWDGRANSLEQQALGPILAEGEMNMPNPQAAVDAIANSMEYKFAFERAYGTKPNWETIGKAIAVFERTIITGPSRFDEYLSGDKAALSDSEKRGLALFTTTASCTACHLGPNFTDNKFHAIGIRQPSESSKDEGRFVVTKNEEDRNCFKTPGLRNIEQSAPYMHDGALSSLEEVVDFYNKGGEDGNNRSKLIRPLQLTLSQKADLVAFLKALTGKLPVIDDSSCKDCGN